MDQSRYTTDYSYRIPAAPVIDLPLAYVGLQDVLAPPLTTINPASGLTVPVKPHSYSHNRTPLGSWTYAQRQQAQSILPNLYLGSMASAKNVEMLKSEGITMLLRIGVKSVSSATSTTSAERAALDLGIAHQLIAIQNIHALISVFPKVSSAIDSHIDSLTTGQAKVLVFCETGNEKSAAAVAAHLMTKYPHLDHVRAMQAVVCQRGCANFDEVMRSMLQSYHDILSAQRAVEQARGVSCGECKKRPLATEDKEDEDGDMCMDVVVDGHEMDAESGRSFSPFVNSWVHDLADRAG